MHINMLSAVLCYVYMFILLCRATPVPQSLGNSHQELNERRLSTVAIPNSNLTLSGNSANVSPANEKYVIPDSDLTLDLTILKRFSVEVDDIGEAIEAALKLASSRSRHELVTADFSLSWSDVDIEIYHENDRATWGDIQDILRGLNNVLYKGKIGHGATFTVYQEDVQPQFGSGFLRTAQAVERNVPTQTY